MTEMKSSELKKICSLASPVFEFGGSASIIPYRFIVTREGFLSQAADIGTLIPYKIETGGVEYAEIPAKEWFSLIDALPNDRDVIMEMDSDKLSLKCGEIFCEFTITPTEIPPLWEEDENGFDREARLPDGFSEALKKSASIASKTSYETYRFVHVAPPGILEATNGARAWKASFSDWKWDHEMIFEAGMAQCLGKYNLKKIKIRSNENLVEMECEESARIRLVFSVVNYPSLSTLWKQLESSPLHNRSEMPSLEPLIRRATIFSSKENPFIRIQKTPANTIVVSSEGEWGHFQEQSPALPPDSTVEDFDIFVDPSYLLGELDDCDRWGFYKIDGSWRSLVLKSSRNNVDVTYAVALAKSEQA
jgi:hypothetical protein